ncbi:low temperature requirement protein A [Glycomyces luteolus]|uniref:Low temperature requirement protein A n=1 Tax=Glycomyces luteolus TaxID=2670330 RepID=A0A9X3PA19_9ACTN|nr:low temperature requirement protein A [Glycomyces luteolus]MDA1360361.1 low temperature requirement protein A [Glycomyces luteolus]
MFSVRDRQMTSPRHATWLELFFDLVVVAAVSQCLVAMHTEPEGPLLVSARLSS